LKNTTGFKVFSLLPQKTLRPINVKIDNTGLKQLHNGLLQELKRAGVEPGEKHGVGLEGRALWDFYFKINRLTTRTHQEKDLDGRKDFAGIMLTDGLSTSLVFSRPKTAHEEEEEVATTNEEVATTEQTTTEPKKKKAKKKSKKQQKEDEEKAQKARKLERAHKLLRASTRVVAVDPGRNPIFTAVVHNQAALRTLQHSKPTNTKHEVIKWSRGRFYQEAGYTHRTRVTKLWMDKDPAIKAFNAEVKSAKTSSLELFKEHASHVLAHLVTVMGFYSAQRFKRLRWKTYIRRQKAYEKLVKDLTAGGDPKKTLIVWGDARFPSNGRGSPSVPTSTLRRKVGARVRTLDQDEYRTSKLSCCCHTEMGSHKDPQTGKSSWKLRICKNNECHRRVWDRNVSAAINILYLFLEFARGEPGDLPPKPFRRRDDVAPQEEQVCVEIA
jgi:hypothetical protein